MGAIEKLHLQFIEEVWAQGNLAIIDDVMAEDIIAHSAHGEIRGRAAFTDYIRMWVETFPDQTVDVQESIAIGDTTVLRWSSDGTHAGRVFLGVPPTQRSMTITGLTIAHWTGDRMREVWFAYDLLNVYEQLTDWNPRANADLLDTFGRYTEALDRHDIPAALSFYTDDIRYDDLATGIHAEDRDSMAGVLETFVRMLPDFRVETTRTVVSGSTVVVEWAVVGTAGADVPAPVPMKAGERVTLPYLTLVEFTDDLKIKAEKNYVNAAALR